MSNRQPPMAVAGVATAEEELSYLETALGTAVRFSHLEPTEALGRLESMTPLVEASKFELIRSARMRGTPWSRIAAALAVSEQQAEAKFGSVDQLVLTG